MSGDEAIVLFSGGKDSSLTAHLLQTAGFNVTCTTVSFGINDAWREAEHAATILGFAHNHIELDRKLLDQACERIVADGRPREGLRQLHLSVVEALAPETAIIADGTRRDDITPKLTPGEMRSLEDRHGTEYWAPLIGMGHRTVRRLADRLFQYEEGTSLLNGDYEREVRARLEELGHDSSTLFPVHVQSKIIGWRSKNG